MTICDRCQQRYADVEHGGMVYCIDCLEEKLSILEKEHAELKAKLEETEAERDRQRRMIEGLRIGEIYLGENA